ncbi:discoidin domain-containing protein [Streptomyces sp. PRB2-1]|uniref:Discoidin domain-containing protein n=2 Tax=Actinacidiphila epipremni TaxID=2053013 RepID=A0ABX0ZLX6_9ACTN|nr:discoidin domain-containing protein [Actinacidiphila epipremni]
MFDGNTATRWSTGVPMANGQSFTLDMGAAKSIDRVVMDSAGSASDYARGYQVYTSTDGTNFGSPVATGTGTAAQVTANFTPTTARYVKVVQTGSSSSWWSIAELNVFTDGSTGGTGSTGAVLPRTGWTATASSSGGGDVPANALDGSTATRWSSGKPMAGGESFTLDLGAAKTFAKLTMDSAGSASDYARGYQVYTSTDGTNFGSPIATGAGTAAQVTVNFTPVTARYVKVVQTGTSSSWWSIAEVNLYD